MNAKQTLRPRASVVKAFVYSALLTAMLYLLIFHFAGSAPARSGGNPPASLQMAENLQAKTAEDLVRASAGKNVQLHFQLSNKDWEANSFFFTTVYYRAVYVMYPRRVYVGSNNRVINYPNDLRAADELPTMDWLRQHGVSAVLSFVPADERGPREMVYHVP